MCSDVGDSTCLLPGFPIRTSSDLSSVGSSPRLIAASHVLHRLLMPRHPPCALTNLATKMLASTVQFSKYGQVALTAHRSTHHHTPHKTRGPGREPFSGTTTHHNLPQETTTPHTGACSLRTQQCAAHQPPTGPAETCQRSTQKMSNHPRQHLRGWLSMLLRKEVIQPHLPVRLPCYDFVPIASPTFAGSLPKG